MPAKFAARRWIALSSVLLGALIPATSAQAALNLSANPNNGRPDDTQAGAHSDFHVNFNVGSDHIRTLSTELPPGLVGNPQSAAFCAPAALVNDNCPTQSRIGTASSDVDATSPDFPIPPFSLRSPEASTTWFPREAIPPPSASS